MSRIHPSKHRKSHHQIVSRLSMDFVLPTEYDGGLISCNSYPSLPFLYYPDYTVAWEANAYMLNLAKLGLSLNNRGGTIAQVAYALSFLLRFFHDNRFRLMDLTNSGFRLFMKGLCGERSSDGSFIRSSTRNRVIGCICLDFMQFVSTDIYGNPGFVARRGNIRAYKSSFSRKNGQVNDRWICPALPQNSKVGRGFPISIDYVSRLRAAAKETKGKTSKRDSVLISFLEQTGGRCDEIGYLRASEVISAFESGERSPCIPVGTAKRVDRMVRFIPVPRIFLHEVMDYIKTSRRNALHKSGKTDHDMLFINMHTGGPLSINSLGNIVHDLKVRASITAKISPHMFRHRFITEKVKALIEEFDMQNEDVLRRSLISSTTIKLKLQQWTGHVRLESLDRYIHLAFDELTNFSTVKTRLHEKAERRIYQEMTEGIMRDFRSGAITADETIGAMDELFQSYFDEMDNVQEHFSV